jgi:AcrR family transcriptional regulator
MGSTDGNERGAKRGYHHGSLKNALLDAARALLAERGPAGFSLAEAAKLVGVTAAAPYRHFADRKALVGELARRGFEQFGSRLQAAWADGKPDPGAALARMGDSYLAFSREEPGLYAAMFGDANTVGCEAASAPAAQAIEILRIAARQALRRRGAIDGAEQDLALEIWAYSHGVAMLALAGHFGPRTFAAQPEQILRRGVGSLLEMAARRAGAG